MYESPPAELTDRLERLGLATAGQVRGVAGRVRRLAKEVPLFESVWVDALAQARVLTPYQAGEINAGRGEALRVGSYLVRRPLASLAYASCYLARESTSGQWVRLAVATSTSPGAKAAGLLDELAGAAGRLESPWLAAVTAAGVDGDRVWAACQHLAGPTAGEWMVHHGRFPPQAVLEIARQMLSGLVVLEKHGLCHGDIGAAALALTPDGRAVLLHPGLRGILRPEEGYARADLQPEAYDYLAPERVAEGTPPTIRSDLYACGCLWWHLLTGRAPVPGGSGLAKLRAAQTTEIADVGHLAPETPAPLAAAVAACVQRQPGLRPASAADLAAGLGPPSARGRAVLARCAEGPGRRPASWWAPIRALRGSKQAPLWLAAAGACLVSLLAVAWSVWGTRAEKTAAAIGSGEKPALAQQAADSGHQADAPTAPLPEVRPADRGGPRADVSGEDNANDLVLSSRGPVAAESLRLRAGLRVRGEPGNRPLVVVPAGGLVVGPENVQFEGVDFLWDDATTRRTEAPQRPTIVQVLASAAEFRRCSFQAAKTASVVPVAIRWTHPPQPNRSETVLPSGRVSLSDCVFRNVGGALACETAGALAVELTNVLHLGSGPLVQLDHCPRIDEPVSIAVSEVTLRGAGPLVECRYERMEDQPGSMSIQADGCALVIGSGTALLSFVGPESPERLLKGVQWTGQGSLVSPETVIARWVQPSGQVATMDEASVSIAGLVRSEVTFAGPAEAGPPANRLVRWQVPLRSPNPPGIDPRSLSWPRP